MSETATVGNSQTIEWTDQFSPVPRPNGQSVGLSLKRRREEMAPAANYNIISVVCNEDDASVRVTKAAIQLLHKNPVAILILSQVAYWFGRPTKRGRGSRRTEETTRTPIWIDGVAYVAANRRQLAKDLQLSLMQVSRGLQTLIKLGLLVRAPFNSTIGNDKLVRLSDHADVQKVFDRTGYGVRLYANVTAACEGNIIAAIVLTNFCYWMGLGKNGKCRASLYDGPTAENPGRAWIMASRLYLSEQLGFKDKQIRLAIQWLLNNGMIEKRKSTVYGSDAAEYSTCPAVIRERILQTPTVTWWTDRTSA
jgi:predicted transcriptional regulator